MDLYYLMFPSTGLIIYYRKKLFHQEILRRPLLQNYIKHLVIDRQLQNSKIIKIAYALPQVKKLLLEGSQEEEESDTSLAKRTKESNPIFTKRSFN